MIFENDDADDDDKFQMQFEWQQQPQTDKIDCLITLSQPKCRNLGWVWCQRDKKNWTGYGHLQMLSEVSKSKKINVATNSSVYEAVLRWKHCCITPKVKCFTYKDWKQTDFVVFTLSTWIQWKIILLCVCLISGSGWRARPERTARVRWMQWNSG